MNIFKLHTPCTNKRGVKYLNEIDIIDIIYKGELWNKYKDRNLKKKIFKKSSIKTD